MDDKLEFDLSISKTDRKQLLAGARDTVQGLMSELGSSDSPKTADADALKAAAIYWSN
jgi:hypothetical protein